MVETGTKENTIYVRVVKRVLGFLIALVATPFVAVAIAILGPMIYFEDKGPIFYNAPRVGKNGKEFKMYKLRSMKVNAPDLVMEDGSTYSAADDPRMTRVGTLMRKTSLDELPQIFNVLKGDMALIGPRPDLDREVELYQGEEGQKLLVKPGITGYAAVYGRNSLPWHDRLALDHFYVHHVSFPLDVKIFFRTFAVVFGQDGIYAEEEGEA